MATQPSLQAETDLTRRRETVPSRSADRTRCVTNFGKNVSFTPAHFYTPAGEDEVREILDRHAHGKVRVIGSLHAWSPGILSEDALIDIRNLNSITVEREPDGTVWATIGGGCQIKHILPKLRKLANVTMPSVGLITEQTIAGAISTGTHGSGRHSLSHYIEEVRIAAYDADGKARISTWKSGPELWAARCGLGCMGVILSVRVRCVPCYDVAEITIPCATIDDALALEEKHLLQQFYLIPHGWFYFAQCRSVTPVPRARRSLGARLYRAYWLLNIDIGLHLLLKTVVSLLRSRFLTRFLYRRVLSKLILKNVTVVDESYRMLTMAHALFRHLEIEIFVPARNLREAATFTREVLEVYDGKAAEPSAETLSALKNIGMDEELRSKRGVFTHHYAITFRRVLPDDTLISMAAGPDETYYAISFITYVMPRTAFFDLASFLARSMTRLFNARLHWGKYFPLSNADIESLYPQLPEFREICRRTDPNGVFRNEFVQRVLWPESVP